MNENALSFRMQFQKFFERSKFSSLRSLSMAAGVSAARASKIVNGEFDNSKVGPGIFIIDSLCKKMGCTPNDLMGYSDSEKIEKEVVPIGLPTIERLVRCYVRSGAHIEGFTDYMHFLQVYDEPKQGRIQLISSGKVSLASRHMGTTDREILQSAFDSASEDAQRSIYEGHLRAWERGIDVDASFLNQRIPDRAKVLRFDFVRAAFKVQTHSGAERLLVYCEIIDQ